MKDARLITTFLIGLTLTLATIMVSLNLYPSWSQHARTLEEPILFATLISISFMYLIKSYSFTDRDFRLFSIGKMNVRSKHMNKATSILFALILVFPVTHEYEWISTAHLIFTALAIATAYIEICFYSRSLLAYIGSAAGVIAFLLAYFLNIYTVGMGELLTSIPIAFFSLWYIKKISNV